MPGWVQSTLCLVFHLMLTTTLPLCGLLWLSLLHEHSRWAGRESGGVHLRAVSTWGTSALGLPPPIGPVTGRPCRLADDRTALNRVQEASEQCIAVAERSGHAHRDFPCAFWNVRYSWPCQWLMKYLKNSFYLEIKCSPDSWLYNDHCACWWLQLWWFKISIIFYQNTS